MKKAGKIATHALGAFLATQAPQALGQEAREVAEPFRIDVSEILRGEQGRFLHVESIAEFAEIYEPGSSLVVEGNYGLSDNVLRELQSYINTHYSHLNVLVYLAQHGGQSRSERDVCGSNNKLNGLRSAFFDNVATGGEGQDLILYLAGTSLEDPERMLCALISPNMAQLIGTDEQIFSPGTALFNDVVAQLRPDFNRVGAIRTFLAGIDERVQRAQREIEQSQLAHIMSVRSIRTQLRNYVSGLEGVNTSGIDIQNTSLYLDFQSKITEVESIVLGEEQYISQENIQRAQRLIGEVDHSYNILVSAITGFESANARVEELSIFMEEFSSGEYADELAHELNELSLSLTQAQVKLESGNIEYYLDMGRVEESYRAILRGVSHIERLDNIKNIGMLGGASLILGSLAYLNRRKKRINSRDEFFAEFEKLKAGLTQMQKIFHEEIEGNTGAIEMFFGNQEGETAQKIEELKTSVAYISVLLPKIEEILEKARSSLGTLRGFRAKSYENAIDILFSDTHIIDPSKSDADKKLLEKISGTEVQDFSQLVENMSKTLPELIEMLDRNISVTQDIFGTLEEASEKSDTAKNESLRIRETFAGEFDALISLLGENFIGLISFKEEVLAALDNVFSDNHGNDILGEYREIVQTNQYAHLCMQDIQALREYIEEHRPAQYRTLLEGNGYDTESFLGDITERYRAYFSAIISGIQHKIHGNKRIDILDEIYAFYDEMKRLVELHRSMIGETEKREGLKRSMDESDRIIREFLGERLTDERLFDEEGSHVPQFLDDTKIWIEELRSFIQKRDETSAQELLAGIKAILITGHEVVENSKFFALSYDESVEKLTETQKSLEEELKGVRQKLQDLEERFDASIMELRESDFIATGSDGDISNNTSEIEEFLAIIGETFSRAETLFTKGNFLESQDELESVYRLLQAVDQRVAEVDGVHNNITQVNDKNPKEFLRIQKEFDEILVESQRLHITEGTQDNITQGGQNLEEIKRMFSEDKPHPYDIEDALFELDIFTQKLKQQVQRDEAEYLEYLEYLEQAEKTFSVLDRKAKDAGGDNQPDSQKVRKIIASMGNLKGKLTKLQGYKDIQNADWYRCTDELEDVIGLYEQSINALSQDEKERQKAYREIEDAAREVRRARNWSGRYVTISSYIGADSLRMAHDAFDRGEFGNAIGYANTAERKAQSEISDAESRDRAEKRRRDAAAAAARRARQRSSYSSISSSSTSSSFSSFGGGGGSGFSGGRF